MIDTDQRNRLEGLTEYLQQVPYSVTRRALYNYRELYAGFRMNDPGSQRETYDGQVYDHYLRTGKTTNDIRESLARTLHDHGMQTALRQFFDNHEARRCVGIMGGHALLRSSDQFRQIVLLSKRLTEEGAIMLSGGGPGAMEATHLGAWMAGRREAEVDDALLTLSTAPSFRDDGWLSSALHVIERYPQQRYVSVGIPTWLYGHEPATPFATYIAKFFENSIREDFILTLPYGGIVYTPGSAGTMQEIFQDAVQNHYVSMGLSSPMVFMGREFWTKQMPVYPMLEKLMETGMYKNLQLTLTDDIDEIAEVLLRFREE